MATSSTPTYFWGELAARVAGEMGLTSNRSPTLTSVIERGVRYIDINEKERALVFDTRALVTGLLAAGQQDPDSIRYGNTAAWFVTWLEARVGQGAITAALDRGAMTSPERVGDAFEHEFRVMLSTSVAGLLPLASDISLKTAGQQGYEARHLFAAMIERGVITDQVRQLFKVDLTDDDLMALRRIFIERVMGAPAPDETAERWYGALGYPAPTPTPGNPSSSAVPPNPPPPDPTPFPPPVGEDRVTEFRGDGVAAGGTDPLDTASDARALARLICLEDAAPLAIAIFGGWGSGKSTFMNRLDTEVEEITRREAARPDAEGGENDARFIRRVVQMRFNAWQFVDANLWASLTAEFFDQLRVGGWNRAGVARHAGLVERVNGHVHALSAEVETTRRAAAAGGKDLLDAQKQRDTAAEAARKAAGETLGQAAIDLLGDTYEAQKHNLTALGLSVSGTDSGAAIDAILDIVRTSQTIFGQLGAIWRVVAKSRLRLFLAGASILLLAGLLLWITIYGIPRETIVTTFVALGAVGSACTALAPAFKLVRGVALRGGGIARSVEAAEQDSLKQLLDREIRLREASAEAAALQAAADRAAKRLSRYIDPAGNPNPPRLLRYVLEDDPDTKALTSEIGLIGRTRRLFQAVDDIVRAERLKPVKDRVDGEVPDRIILYIDDLDRCTEEQVYAVLQATHLLLAFDLFVVVVGVDVSWVQNALARTMSGVVTNTETERRQRAAHYLDKIFQIAFWLKPLSSEGKDGGSFGRYVRGLMERKAAPPRAPAANAGATPGEPGVPDQASGPAAAPPAQEVAGAVAAGQAEAPVSSPANQNPMDQSAAAESAKALETIQLLPEEIDLLASPAIARIAATTPRAVKRLINVYRLVRTRLAETPAPASPGSPPDYPLIALMVAIETGQPIEVADAVYEALATLPPGDALHQQIFFKSPTDGDNAPIKAIRTAYTQCEPLKDAVEQVMQLRGGDLVIRDALRIARVARRFSFNRFR